MPLHLLGRDASPPTPRPQPVDARTSVRSSDALPPLAPSQEAWALPQSLASWGMALPVPDAFLIATAPLPQRIFSLAKQLYPFGFDTI